MGAAAILAFHYGLLASAGSSHPRRYSDLQLPPEKLQQLIPRTSKFNSRAQLHHGCAIAGFGAAGSTISASMEDFRLTVQDFYGTGMPLLSSYHWVEAILQMKLAVAEVCAPAVLQAMLLQLGCD